MFRKDLLSSAGLPTTPDDQATTRQTMPADDALSLFDSHKLFTTPPLINLIFDYVPLDGLNPKKNDTEYNDEPEKEETKAESKKQNATLLIIMRNPK